MIRFELQDDDLFFEVLHNYQEQFADSTATGLDFMGVLNETSGMDFTDFFNQWYFGEGYPTYSIEWSQDNANAYFQVTQTTSKPSVTPLFKMLMGYKLKFYDQTDTIIYRYQDENVISFSIPLTKDIGVINVDPGNWVINKVGSITINVDENTDRYPFTMGPNPANDVLNFNFFDNKSASYSVSIHNLSGAEVVNQTINSSLNQVNISKLAAGSYVVKVTDGKNVYNKKLIISK
jgi:aminopeptidase N